MFYVHKFYFILFFKAKVYWLTILKLDRANCFLTRLYSNINALYFKVYTNKIHLWFLVVPINNNFLEIFLTIFFFLQLYLLLFFFLIKFYKYHLLSFFYTLTSTSRIIHHSLAPMLVLFKDIYKLMCPLSYKFHLNIIQLIQHKKLKSFITTKLYNCN